MGMANTPVEVEARLESAASFMLLSDELADAREKYNEAVSKYLASRAEVSS
jgi:hypothetical protein